MEEENNLNTIANSSAFKLIKPINSNLILPFPLRQLLADPGN